MTLRCPSSTPSDATAAACTAQPKPYANAEVDRNSAEACFKATNSAQGVRPVENPTKKTNKQTNKQTNCDLVLKDILFFVK